MAIRLAVQERVPLDNCEVEYERSSGSRKERRPGFNRARLLDIGKEQTDIATREAFRNGEKVQLTFHVKTVRDFLKVPGTVHKSTRINILKQPAFSVLLTFEKISDDQAKKLAWIREQLVPKTPVRPIRRPEDEPAAKEKAPAAAPVARQQEKKAVADAASPPAGGSVQRPVALLELIDQLDNFQVTDDLIMAVIEAAEGGMDVEVLYPASAKGGSAETYDEEESAAAMFPTDGQAKPMNVYRLAANTRLHFSKEGVPVGPPIGLFYLSSIRSPETCFAVQLDTDHMAHAGAPSFRRGSTLIFDAKTKAESGQFAFVKSRGGDEFAQVFLDKGDEVRLRPLNAAHPEQVLRRSEIKLICRLVGCYEDMAIE